MRKKKHYAIKIFSIFNKIIKKIKERAPSVAFSPGLFLRFKSAFKRI
jgi:hypothetical protein